MYLPGALSSAGPRTRNQSMNPRRSKLLNWLRSKVKSENGKLRLWGSNQGVGSHAHPLGTMVAASVHGGRCRHRRRSRHLQGMRQHTRYRTRSHWPPLMPRIYTAVTKTITTGQLIGILVGLSAMMVPWAHASKLRSGAFRPATQVHCDALDENLSPILHCVVLNAQSCQL